MMRKSRISTQDSKTKQNKNEQNWILGTGGLLEFGWLFMITATWGFPGHNNWNRSRSIALCISTFLTIDFAFGENNAYFYTFIRVSARLETYVPVQCHIPMPMQPSVQSRWFLDIYCKEGNNSDLLWLKFRLLKSLCSLLQRFSEDRFTLVVKRLFHL